MVPGMLTDFLLLRSFTDIFKLYNTPGIWDDKINKK